MEVVENSSVPLIDRSHLGSFGNKRGYEGGTVFMHEGEFHMFVTEEIDGWINTRTGYWKSAYLILKFSTLKIAIIRKTEKTLNAKR